jgi:hypothetical protein
VLTSSLNAFTDKSILMSGCDFAYNKTRLVKVSRVEMAPDIHIKCVSDNIPE